MKVKGHNVLRWPYASVEEFKAKPGAERHSASWRRGPIASTNRRSTPTARATPFDMELGNVRGAIPIHGFLQTTNQWQVVEAKADAPSAWVTSRLEFFRQPAWMKQWPFAHTIEMTYRLQDGVLEVRTTLTNLSAEPMPVAIGFHPYFQLTDVAARRVDDRGRRAHALAAGRQQGADRRDRADRAASSRIPRRSPLAGLQPGRRVRRSRARRRRAARRCRWPASRSGSTSSMGPNYPCRR